MSKLKTADIPGEELAALVVTALPHADWITITEIGDKSVKFTYRSREWDSKADVFKPLFFHLFTVANPDRFLLMQQVRFRAPSKKPPHWTNDTDLCGIMLALFHLRWSPYNRYEFDTDLRVAGDAAVKPEAKVISISQL